MEKKTEPVITAIVRAWCFEIYGFRRQPEKDMGKIVRISSHSNLASWYPNSKKRTFRWNGADCSRSELKSIQRPSWDRNPTPHTIYNLDHWNMSSFYIIFYLPAVISLYIEVVPFLPWFHAPWFSWVCSRTVDSPWTSRVPKLGPVLWSGGMSYPKSTNSSVQTKSLLQEVKISHSLCTMDHHVVYFHYQSTTSIIHNLDVYGPNVMFSFLVPEFQKTASLLRGLELLLYVELLMANWPDEIMF